jgi:translation initiation factor IF-1
MFSVRAEVWVSLMSMARSSARTRVRVSVKARVTVRDRVRIRFSPRDKVILGPHLVLGKY